VNKDFAARSVKIKSEDNSPETTGRKDHVIEEEPESISASEMSYRLNDSIRRKYIIPNAQLVSLKE
jgi:hypothetical protein